VIESDGKTLVAVQRSDLTLNSRKGRELAIADNRAAELDLNWDFDTLKTLDADLTQFWNEAEFTKNFGRVDAAAPEPKADKADELQQKWKTARGQLWIIVDHRLMCGDSSSTTDLARLFDGQEYQTVVTSPPYFLDRSYEHGFTPDGARKLLREVAAAWFKLAKVGGYFFDNFAGIQGWEISKPWAGADRCEYPAALLHWETFRPAGWLLHAERIWVKPHAQCVGQWVLSTKAIRIVWHSPSLLSTPIIIPLHSHTFHAFMCLHGGAK